MNKPTQKSKRIASFIQLTLAMLTVSGPTVVVVGQKFTGKVLPHSWIYCLFCFIIYVFLVILNILKKKKHLLVTDKTKVDKEILDKVKGDILQSCSINSNRDKFCDFTVVVGDTEFPCHKLVLSGCSGYFHSLLMRSDMKESQATINGISPETFHLILDVIYGSTEVLVPDAMSDIWKAAHQLQIQFLITACESHFMQNINDENCYLIYTHAQLLQSTQVRTFVLNYIKNNFYTHVQSDNLMKLEYEDFIKIIENNYLPICADLKIVAILKWCECENINKQKKSLESSQESSKVQFLGSLIQAVDLPKVTALSLANLLTNPFIQEDKVASAAINTHAAKKLEMFHAGQGPSTGTKDCQHCKDCESSDESDNDLIFYSL